MKYVFPLNGAYSSINHIAKTSDIPIEHSVFSDIVINFLQANIKRWYFGQNVDNHSAMLYVGLSQYLTASEVDIYMEYLDNVFWPSITLCMSDVVSPTTAVTLSINSNNSLVIELSPEPTPLELVIDRICVDVDHRLYNGDYIDPILKEIYDANLQSRQLSGQPDPAIQFRL